jgi:hypothetical protein
MDLEDRHSQAFEAELVSDPDEKAHLEAKNGVRQFDLVVEQNRVLAASRATLQATAVSDYAVKSCGSGSDPCLRRSL